MDACCDRVVFRRNLLVNEVFVLEDEIDLGCGRRTLQLLTIQHLVLQLLDSLRHRNMRHTREMNLNEEI